MTVLWTSTDAAAATGGTTGTWVATGLSIDTRELVPGDLFIALKDVRDGHDFVTSALDQGAAAALVSRVPDGISPNDPRLLLVDDTQRGLEDLARAARARTAAKVIGVTGSVGKTSTKDMLRQILAGQGATHAAVRSFNNHWGVPLTLARMPKDTQFAVIEIGMNAPGEIAPLARMAGLDVALITTVAAAHFEAFGSLEGIAREKASIIEGLRPGGTAILPADLSVSPILIQAAAGLNLTTFGAVGGDARLTDVQLTPDATLCSVTWGGERFHFKLATPGRHFALNALGALIAAQAVGADLGLAAIDLGQWQPPQGRGVRETITLDPVEGQGIQLIDDAFNANPASLGAAFEVLAAQAPVDGVGRVGRGRRVAILGDMLELGGGAPALHAEMADHPAMADIDLVHVAGPLMAHLWRALPAGKQGVCVDTAQDLCQQAGRLIDAGDVVLVKGSKGSRVSLVVDALRKLGQADRNYE